MTDRRHDSSLQKVPDAADDDRVVTFRPEMFAGMVHALAEQEMQVDTADAEVAALTVEHVKAADEATFAATVETAALAIADGNPPAADPSDLPPARAKLKQHLAWIADLRDQASRLEDGRAEHLHQIGVPDVRRKEIEDLRKDDQRKLLSWMKAGGKKLDQPTLREFEKEEIEKKLTADTYAASAAKEALAAAETEVEVLRRAATILDGRTDALVHDALIEQATPLGSELMQAVAIVNDTYAKLLGLCAYCWSLSWLLSEFQQQARS